MDCDNNKFNNIKVFASINNCRPNEKDNDFIFKIKGKTAQIFKGFIGSASRLWNKAPDSIKMSITLYRGKKEIKTFLLTPPE